MIDRRLAGYFSNKRMYYTKLTVGSVLLAMLAIAQAVLIAGIINDVFLVHRELSSEVVQLVGLCCIFTFRPMVALAHERIARDETERVKEGLRIRLSNHAHQTCGSIVERMATGEMGTLSVEGVESLDAWYSEYVPQLFHVAVSSILILIAVFTRDVISGGIMVFTAPLIPVFMILIGKTADGVSRKQWDSLQMMNGHLLDVLRGMVTLRLFEKHQSQATIVERISEQFRKSTLKILRISFLSAFTLELLATISTAVVAVSLGLRLLYGHMVFLPAMTVLLLTPEYFQPLRQLGQKFHAAMNGQAAADHMEPFLKDESHYEVKKEGSTVENFEIAVKNLTFSYSDGSVVIENLSFEAKTGSSVAVLGPSGIGKSTLLKLLAGVEGGYEGSIRFGGTELREIEPRVLRDIVSYVPQHPRIFRGTVMENIRFGRPDASIEEAVVLSKRTGLHEAILRMPDGYDTHIGEGTRSMSGGEMQLLAITRAWLRNTPVVLMDEPTSAMDIHTEESLAKGIEALKVGRTLIVSAHRRRTAALCDRQLILGGEQPC